MNNYLRVRIDKTVKGGELLPNKNCNLACPWCHGDYFRHISGIKALTNKELINCVNKVISASSRESAQINISGQGEPCLSGEKELCDLITRLHLLSKVSRVNIVTNGILLGKMAESLKEAGLDEVAITLHTLKKERYKEMVGRDCLEEVLKGISAALKAGLNVRINVVYNKLNEDEIWDFVDFARKNSVPLKFLNLLLVNQTSEDLYISIKEICNRLESRAKSKKVKRYPYWVYEYYFGNDDVSYVSVKISTKNPCPNTKCSSRSKCLEGCRSSVRIGQDGILHPCGVREDNAISLVNPQTCKEKIIEALLSGGKN